MKLYFLRHGEAVDIAETDHDRQLTPSGQQRIQHAAQVMKAMELRPQYIYASPRVRARQTAEIVGQALNVTVEISEAVNFSFSPSAVEDLIRGLDRAAEVMFVGHEPSMSDVVGELCGGNVVMKKGGLARVDMFSQVAPLRGQLIWLIAPKVFDNLNGDS